MATCISKSGKRSSRADATEATDALETESSEEEEGGAGAWDRDRRRPLLRQRPDASRLPGTYVFARDKYYKMLLLGLVLAASPACLVWVF